MWSGNFNRLRGKNNLPRFQIIFKKHFINFLKSVFSVDSYFKQKNNMTLRIMSCTHKKCMFLDLFYSIFSHLKNTKKIDGAGSSNRLRPASVPPH